MSNLCQMEQATVDPRIYQQFGTAKLHTKRCMELEDTLALVDPEAEIICNGTILLPDGVHIRTSYLFGPLSVIVTTKGHGIGPASRNGVVLEHYNQCGTNGIHLSYGLHQVTPEQIAPYYEAFAEPIVLDLV